MSIKRTDPNAMEVSLSVTSQDWRQWYLLLADVHFDSPYCDRRLLKSLLDEAVARDAGILCFGDWFDGMQLRDDRRRTKAELRKDYAGSATPYTDLLVDESVEFRKPYASHWLMDCTGNHDAAVAKYAETDILGRVCRALHTEHFGYSGYVKFRFKRNRSGGRTFRDLFFEHGSGGGGVVTRGTLKPSRSVGKATADIYISGHIHESWRMTWPVWRNSTGGKPYTVNTLHLCCPPVKNENDLARGHNTTSGRGPKPFGGMWLYFEYHPRAREYVHQDAIEAV